MIKRILCSVLAFLIGSYIYFFWIPPILGFGGINILSNSMAPNLLRGDKVFVYITTPELGDVLVAKDSLGNSFAKRLVGLSGDEICYSGDNYIRENNQYKKYVGEYEDSHGTKYEMYGELAGKQYFNTIYTSKFDPKEVCLTVPQDQLFYLGDNRTRSIDSRRRSFPKLPSNYGHYKLSFVFYSNDLSRIFKSIN